MDIAVFKGYKFILHWLIKLITEFSRFQKVIQTIFIGFACSIFWFMKVYEKTLKIEK